MSWFTKGKADDSGGGWFGMSKRERNHMAWESASPFFAIRAKGREARTQGIAKQNRRASRRTQRNNRREY